MFKLSCLYVSCFFFCVCVCVWWCWWWCWGGSSTALCFGRTLGTVWDDRATVSEILSSTVSGTASRIASGVVSGIVWELFRALFWQAFAAFRDNAVSFVVTVAALPQGAFL